MTFCTPVTPTRERLTLVVGRSACTSSEAVWSREIGSSIRPRKLARKRKCDFARSGVWWPRGRVLEDSQPEAPGHSRLVSRIAGRGERRESEVVRRSERPGEAAWRGATVTAKDEGTALLATDEQDAPFSDIEEMQTLVADGRGRGCCVFE